MCPLPRSSSCLQYFEIPHIAIGGYSHQLDNETGAPLPIQFNLEQYAKAELDVSNSRYQLNGTIVEGEGRGRGFSLAVRRLR